MKQVNLYRIQLEKIRQARGTFSDDLKEKILTSSKTYCSSLDNDLPLKWGWLDAETILKDFLDGKPFADIPDTAKHWYVVELLCNGFGKELPADTWQHTSLADLYDYDEFRMYFLGMDPLVRLPAPEANPLVFTIENHQLENAKLKIDNSSYSDEQKNQFIDWVQIAMDHEQDLILFCY